MCVWVLLSQRTPLSPSPCPQVHCLHLCFYSCPANRFISTIFLDFIYICVNTHLFFSFWLPSLCMTYSRFIHITTNDQFRITANLNWQDKKVSSSPFLGVTFSPPFLVFYFFQKHKEKEWVGQRKGRKGKERSFSKKDPFIYWSGSSKNYKLGNIRKEVPLALVPIYFFQSKFSLGVNKFFTKSNWFLLLQSF